MNWKRVSPHFLAGDLGYKICRNKVVDDIYYRPSYRGSFISAPLRDLDAAKAACDQHAKENAE